MFACPDCRQPFRDLTCTTCGVTYPSADGIPDLLGSSEFARRCRQIGAFYDGLYRSRVDVWREQGHTDAFTQYVVALVESGGPGRYLDVGCGEGFFLAASARMDIYGIDLSREALQRARARSGATVAVGCAERLPFTDATFDVVTSIGAMEHFLDDAAATQEIRRVLRRGGRYVLALLTEVTFAERVGIKAREFLWPQPRPREAARWLQQALFAPKPTGPAPAFPAQPIQNRYRPERVASLFEQSGFRLARQIRRSDPAAPLPGHYMRFYCLEAV